jgi:hypothetical protein
MTTEDPPEAERPLSRHAAARLGYALASVEISDYTAAVVPTSNDKLADPGEFITQARRVRKMAMELLVRAVLLERALGHSWKQIAHAHGYSEKWVREKYEPIEQEWLALLDGAPPSEAGTIEMAYLMTDVPLTDTEIRETAAELDAWCYRRRDENSPEPTLRLVSDGLAG